MGRDRQTDKNEKERECMCVFKTYMYPCGCAVVNDISK